MPTLTSAWARILVSSDLRKALSSSRYGTLRSALRRQLPLGKHSPQLVIDAVSLAQKLGFMPFFRDSIARGKALHVHGYLGEFSKLAPRNANELSDIAATGAVLVGLDPSMTLTFRSEYKAAAKTTPEVLLPQEWLCRNIERLTPCPGMPFAARLLLHCTERTNVSSAADEWKAVFEAVGASISIPSLGCSGMAGTFGHEKKNRKLSETIYAMSWAREFSQAARCEQLATGFSCRCQVERMEGHHIRHPIEALNALIR